jgi:hypothetical protein
MVCMPLIAEGEYHFKKMENLSRLEMTELKDASNRRVWFAT